MKGADQELEDRIRKSAYRTVVVYLQQHLARQLASNHRPGEEGRPFPTLGAANWITLLRAGAVVGLAGFVPAAVSGLPQGMAWAPGLIYLGVSLADLLDGFVARKQNRVTELGKRLDIATDAAGLLVASLLAICLGRLPALYLLVGLAYYLFIFGIRLRQKRTLPLVTLHPRPYARIIAGFQMGLVGMALLPLFEPPFTYVAAFIFMTPFLLGFLRDWLVVSCRVETDGFQQTAAERWARPLLTGTLPLLSRLIIPAGGIAVLVAGEVHQTHPAWQLILSGCCLLAVLGCMGRIAGLVLSLLLASPYSPFGTSMAALSLFAAAAALMLTGSGAMSLWSPEEVFLYRRKPGSN
jgi:CDP-diacylglycerol--glycerol-3-phosphate 3-phosphatidyltransferase